MKTQILFAVLSISIWHGVVPAAAQESPDLAKADVAGFAWTSSAGQRVERLPAK